MNRKKLGDKETRLSLNKLPDIRVSPELKDRGASKSKEIENRVTSLDQAILIGQKYDASKLVN